MHLFVVELGALTDLITIIIIVFTLILTLLIVRDSLSIIWLRRMTRLTTTDETF